MDLCFIRFRLLLVCAICAAAQGIVLAALSLICRRRGSRSV
ncbi:Uncharacterised protein [Vibrio cholerae]|nr:Uncharacterised protein [Vibrio cholerae]